MKRCIFLLAVVLLFVGIAGCEPAEIPRSVVQSQSMEIEKNTEIIFNDSNTLTVGNNSYIAINRREIPGNNPKLILEVLAKFDETHPELSVKDWKIEAYIHDRFWDGMIFGLWIHHLPKAKPPQ